MLKQMLVFCFVLGLRVLVFFLILALYHLASAVVNTAGHQQVTGPIVIHLMLMGMLFFLILVLGSSSNGCFCSVGHYTVICVKKLVSSSTKLGCLGLS